MRTLAIDLGSRRVGLALSDEGGKFATAFDVLEVAHPKDAEERVARLVEAEGVQRLVVGLPLNMDGSFGPAAKNAAMWGRSLAARCKLPVIFIDERLSSFEAEQRLVDRKRGGEKITRKGKKQRLDALAAAAFLQAFLDGKAAALDVPA